MESQVEQTSDAMASKRFDGSWERAHRNITAAACIGLLITGVLYVYAQSFLTIIFVFINSSGELHAFKGEISSSGYPTRLCY